MATTIDPIAIVGAVTGITGTILGILAYRQSSQLKSLDLRIELHKRRAEVEQLVGDLPDFISGAKQSRERVNAATGRNSGFDRWADEATADASAARGLASALAEIPFELDGKSHSELERWLVTAERVLAMAKTLQSKYADSIAEDDVLRREIRAAHSSRVPPRI